MPSKYKSKARKSRRPPKKSRRRPKKSRVSNTDRFLSATAREFGDGPFGFSMGHSSAYLRAIIKEINKIKNSDKATRDYYHYKHNSGLSLNAIKKLLGITQSQWRHVNNALRIGVDKGYLKKTKGRYRVIKIKQIKKKSRRRTKTVAQKRADCKKKKLVYDKNTGKCRPKKKAVRKSRTKRCPPGCVKSRKKKMKYKLKSGKKKVKMSKLKFKMKRSRDASEPQTKKARKRAPVSSAHTSSCVNDTYLAFDDFAQLHPGAAKIVSDIMYNYTTAFIGTYMRDIVTANGLNDKIVVLPRVSQATGSNLSSQLMSQDGKHFNLTPSLEAGLGPAALTVTSALANPQFEGFLIPTGRSDDDVHWKYIQRNGTVWDPANQGMQPIGSQQYCQAHSLRMARDESARKQHGQVGAYTDLLPMFNEIFMTQFMPIRQLLVNAITAGVNGELDADVACAKKYIADQICSIPLVLPSVNVGGNDFKTFHCALIKILESEYAKRTHPYF